MFDCFCLVLVEEVEQGPLESSESASDRARKDRVSWAKEWREDSERGSQGSKGSGLRGKQGSR
jgi:hypothetical protein